MKWYSFEDREDALYVYLNVRAKNFAKLYPDEPHVIHPEVLYKVMAKFAMQEIGIDRRRNRRLKRLWRKQKGS